MLPGRFRTPEKFTTSSSAKVYEGYYKSEEEAQAAGAKDITAQVWNQPNMALSGGYSGKYAGALDSVPKFTLVCYQDGVLVQCVPFAVKMFRDEVSISPPPSP